MAINSARERHGCFGKKGDYLHPRGLNDYRWYIYPHPVVLGQGVPQVFWEDISGGSLRVRIRGGF